MSRKPNIEAPQPPGIQPVTVDCLCGKKHTVRVGHYDRVILPCRLAYWALQPRRNGPLELHPWPGHNLTNEEYKARYGKE